MKTRILAFIVILTLTACCIQTPQSGKTTTTSTQAPKNEYTGFKILEVGDWVEYSIQEGKTLVQQKMTYLGAETVSGRTLTGLEVQLKNESGHIIIFQVWIDSEGGKAAEYAARINGNVLCTTNASVLQKISPLPELKGTPDKYAPGKSTKSQLFTVGGKQLYAFYYETGDASAWVSESVPFGLVSANSQDGTRLDLLDYGSGSKRTITKYELDNCKKI